VPTHSGKWVRCSAIMALNASLPVVGLSSSSSQAGHGLDVDSLAWLWPTVGATCCWAMSDVICDLCIKQRPEESEIDEQGAEVEFDLAIEEDRQPAASLLVSDDLQFAGRPLLEPLHLPETPPKDIMAAGPRHRKRSKANGVACEAASGAPKVPIATGGLLARPPASPARAGLPPASPAGSVSQPASPRTSLRSPVSVVPHTHDPSNYSSGNQLTPEQNALLSGCISLCVAAAISIGYQNPGVSRAEGIATLFRCDAAGALAAVGGCFHFSAYLATLCAFSSASSTVITPLMQLSAMWMLPFSMSAALLGWATFIRPVHLLAVGLICSGGLLPAAHGSLAGVASASFWKQSAVRYVVLGELLICCYNVILHQATFGLFVHGSDPQAVVSPDSDAGGMGSSLRFFLVSRTMNGLSCVCLFLVVPSLRAHARAMRSVGTGFFMTSLVGECLSTLGVCLVTFSYSSFYEPSVVNAVEGGLQQLFNLLFALATHRFLGWGRGVDQVSVKIVSFLIVASGLFLSTV